MDRGCVEPGRGLLGPGHGEVELAAVVLESCIVKRCMATKWLTHALNAVGHKPSDFDGAYGMVRALAAADLAALTATSG